MIPFHNRLLVGVGNALRVYDLGKRKLLRKSEVKVGAVNTFLLLTN